MSDAALSSTPATLPRTTLSFQREPSTTSTLTTTLQAIYPYPALSLENQALFKSGTENDYALITHSTIFHPQGGGQPSDTGTMHVQDNNEGVVFQVLAARMSADSASEGAVLHFGHFTGDQAGDTTVKELAFTPGLTLIQSIDVAKRLLYSRYHTAGHVLGAAVRSLLESSVPGFDELKASHFPDSAACEFAGSIDGNAKPAIQARVDEYVSEGRAVSIEWWDEERFRAEGLLRLLPEGEMPAEKWRVVRIEGAECYPCGGTHVATTRECGKTIVRKIARKGGQSRVSYALE